MFNDLDKLEVGDAFVVEVLDQVLTYQVVETQIVEPSDTKTVLPRPGEGLVTLITHAPLGNQLAPDPGGGERITPTPIAGLEALEAVP